jgi:hypothetical protein
MGIVVNTGGEYKCGEYDTGSRYRPPVNDLHASMCTPPHPLTRPYLVLVCYPLLHYSLSKIVYWLYSSDIILVLVTLGTLITPHECSASNVWESAKGRTPF